MTLFAVIVFLLSIGGIVGLFVMKTWETNHGRVLFAGLHEQADTFAAKCKVWLAESNTELARVPPLLLRTLSYLIHEFALLIAAGARIAEKQAHRLADFVSHKHRFERKETQSEFLKKVSEVKNTDDVSGLE